MLKHDDAALVRQSLEGQSRAFESLVDRYQKPIFNAALRVVGDYDDARDITQAVFVKAYEKLDTFDPCFKFFSWIYRMAINEALNLIKQRRQHDRVDDTMAAPHMSPAEQLEENDLSERIQDAIVELSIDYRIIIVLRHFADLSHRELSFVLDIPEKTVKSRLYTARRLLSGILLKRGIVTND